MFEDKRFDNDDLNKNRFFIPDDNATGLNDGNGNLNFKAQSTYIPEPEPIKRKTKKTKNYKGLIIFFIVVVVIAFLAGTFFVVKEMFSSPVAIYKKSVELGYEAITDVLKEQAEKKLNYDIREDTILNSGEIGIDTDLPSIADFGKYTYGYKLNMDFKNNQIDGGLLLNNKGTNLLDLKAYLRDKKIYLEEGKIYNKILELDNKEVANLDMQKFTRSIEANDFINILKCVKDYIVKNINKNSITKEKETIEVNNKSLKVTSNIYIIKKEEVIKHYEAILEALQKDDNALESLGDIFGLSKREMAAKLKELKGNKELLQAFAYNIEIKIYTKGFFNDFLGISLLLDGDEVLKSISEDNLTNFNILGEDYKLNVLSNKEGKTFKLSDEDTDFLKGKITKDGDITNIDFVFKQVFTIEGKIKIDYKRVGDKRRTLDLVLDLLFKNKNDEVNITFKLNNMTQVGTKLENVKLDNVKKVDDLKDEEIDQIQKKLLKVLEQSPFYDYYLDYTKKVNQQIKNKMNCLQSFDCYCEGDECDCRYKDVDGIEKGIICSKDLVSTN